jgi:hypothetical protein
MKQINYWLVRSNGDIVKMRCPDLFSPHDVAKRLQHSLVFFQTPKDSTALVDFPLDRTGSKFVSGIVYINSDLEAFEMPEAPRNEIHAGNMIDTYARRNKAA